MMKKSFLNRGLQSNKYCMYDPFKNVLFLSRAPAFFPKRTSLFSHQNCYAKLLPLHVHFTTFRSLAVGA